MAWTILCKSQGTEIQVVDILDVMSLLSIQFPVDHKVLIVALRDDKFFENQDWKVTKGVKGYEKSCTGALPIVRIMRNSEQTSSVRRSKS